MRRSSRRYSLNGLHDLNHHSPLIFVSHVHLSTVKNRQLHTGFSNVRLPFNSHSILFPPPNHANCSGHNQDHDTSPVNHWPRVARYDTSGDPVGTCWQLAPTKPTLTLVVGVTFPSTISASRRIRNHVVRTLACWAETFLSRYSHEPNRCSPRCFRFASADHRSCQMGPN